MRENTAQQIAEVLAPAAVFALLFCAYFVGIVKPGERRMHAVEQCVVEQWQQFEDVRSQMPSIEQEQQWRVECVERLRGAS
tara:strand:- start:250 stop:492 length:243 start_codon:yes stop_codon:yes gene_type:complete